MTLSINYNNPLSFAVKQLVQELDKARSNYQDLVTSRCSVQSLVEALLADCETIQSDMEEIREQQRQIELLCQS
jgi:hypothetical protein